jgi:hypothetical protein
MSDDSNPATAAKRRVFLKGVATVGIATGFGTVVGDALAQNPFHYTQVGVSGL